MAYLRNNKPLNVGGFLMHHWQSVFDCHDTLFDTLMAHYGQPHRHYHNAYHLYECFLWFDKIKDKLLRADLLVVALFYHDVIYEPTRFDNEIMSADMMVKELKNIINNNDLSIIYQYILATKEHINPLNDAYKNDLDYLLDIDLAILGSYPDRFDEYHAQIRQEYHWVDDNIYTIKRKSVLQAFYDKDRIYLTDYFYQKLESQARENLKRYL